MVWTIFELLVVKWIFGENYDSKFNYTKSLIYFVFFISSTVQCFDKQLFASFFTSFYVSLLCVNCVWCKPKRTYGYFDISLRTNKFSMKSWIRNWHMHCSGFQKSKNKKQNSWWVIMCVNIENSFESNSKLIIFKRWHFKHSFSDICSTETVKLTMHHIHLIEWQYAKCEEILIFHNYLASAADIMIPNEYEFELCSHH